MVGASVEKPEGLEPSRTGVTLDVAAVKKPESKRPQSTPYPADYQLTKRISTLNATDIRPFIPSKDYEVSKAFYESLGFKGESAGPDLTIFQKSGCTFFLQRYFNEEFANNLMLQLIVENIDDAYKLVSGLSGVKHSDIKKESWGSVIYLWGPSGELWHITELGS